MKPIKLSNLSEETQAAIKKELANKNAPIHWYKSKKQLASQEKVTLRFDGYDQPKALTDYIAQGYPELKEHGEFWQKKSTLSVPSIVTFMEWLHKAPSYRSIEAIHGRDGTNDILVRTHSR